MKTDEKTEENKNSIKEHMDSKIYRHIKIDNL